MNAPRNRVALSRAASPACKLPPLPTGRSYDPDKLYFRYKLEDGKYTATFTASGNYDVKYPYPN